MAARRCQFCWRLAPRNEMTQVPESRQKRAEWSEIFGVDFEKRIANKKYTYVCREHFLSDRGRQRLKNQMPVVNSEEKAWISRKVPEPVGTTDQVLLAVEASIPAKEEFQMNGKRCRFCWRMAPQEEMTKVPQSEEKREEWSKILGVDFKRQIANKKHVYICRQHFLSDGGRHRLRNQTPIVTALEESWISREEPIPVAKGPEPVEDEEEPTTQSMGTTEQLLLAVEASIPAKELNLPEQGLKEPKKEFDEDVLKMPKLEEEPLRNPPAPPITPKSAPIAPRRLPAPLWFPSINKAKKPDPKTTISESTGTKIGWKKPLKNCSTNKRLRGGKNQ